MADLKARSIQIILQNQKKTGAYLVSPFAPYCNYASIRDGSFIAFAMLINGEADSSERFLHWVHKTIEQVRSKVDELEKKIRSDQHVDQSDYLPVLYTLLGNGKQIAQPYFQFDGYGAWLWCLAEYIEKTGNERLIIEFQESIRTIIRYLQMVWNLPSMDCWGENGTGVHPSELACIYGGLERINRFLGEREVNLQTQEIRRFILSNLSTAGRFPKDIGSEEIDSSLLWLAVPFRITEPDSPPMKKTVKAIEKQLLEEGGIRRYKGDKRYGEGQSIPLTCWFGWYCLTIGKNQIAERHLRWVEMQGDENGYLPELVQVVTKKQEVIENGNQQKIARPFLWSHAQYLILHQGLEALKS